MDALDKTAKTGAAPDPAELIARAEALAPTLRARAEAAEKARRVSAESMADIAAQDIFGLLQPKRFGGLEYDFATLVDIQIALASGCTSTAWCAGLVIAHQWLLASFPLEAQEEVWGADAGAMLCGSYAPAGTCEAVDGGWRVSGRWSFASNVDNSSWSILGVVFPPGADGEKPQPGFTLVPARDYRVHDDWHTVGLAATGSKDVICEDAFVPAHRRVTFAELGSGSSPGTRVHRNPLYRIPMMAGLPYSICTPALGALKGAIDDFVAGLGGRATRGAVVAGGNKVAEFPHVQSRLGLAGANFNAAHSLVMSDIAAVADLVARGEPIGVDRRIRNRLTQSFVVRLAGEGIDALYATTGGPGLHLTNRIQRAWRDIHAIAHHVSFNWDAVSSMYGQHALGLEPRGQY